MCSSDLFVPLDELLEQSDFVTLHAASTPQNRGMLGEAQFRKMKRSAYLINAGRGALIDEAALVKALKEGWIAGAGLDVWEDEPPPHDHPLLAFDNAIEPGDTVFFFYAGHGFEIAGQNFLLPTDVPAATEYGQAGR